MPVRRRRYDEALFRLAKAEEALGELYDAAVKVTDATNPDLKRDRQRLSLLLDKIEPLVTAR